MATTTINRLRFARRPKDAGVPDAKAESMGAPVFTLVGACEPKAPHRRCRRRRAAADRGCGARACESHHDGARHHCDRHRDPGTRQPGAAVIDALSTHVCDVGLVAADRRVAMLLPDTPATHGARNGPHRTAPVRVSRRFRATAARGNRVDARRAGPRRLGPTRVPSGRADRHPARVPREPAPPAPRSMPRRGTAVHDRNRSR